jgi:hypothetical protein
MGPHEGAMNLPAGVAVSDEGVELFADRLHPGFAPRRLIAVTNQFGPTKVVVYAMGERRPEYSAQALASAAAPVASGVGSPSADQLKIQNPGGEEPPLEAPGDPKATAAPTAPPTVTPR